MFVRGDRDRVLRSKRMLVSLRLPLVVAFACLIALPFGLSAQNEITISIRNENDQSLNGYLFIKDKPPKGETQLNLNVNVDEYYGYFDNLADPSSHPIDGAPVAEVHGGQLAINPVGSILEALGETENIWHQVVIVRDRGAGLARMYIDGAQVQTSPDSNASITTNSIFAIGHRAGGTRYFQGSLDEIKIYDRALSASQIMNLYNAEKPCME